MSLCIYLSISLVKVKDSWVYINPKRHRELREILLKDSDPVYRLKTIMHGTKASTEFDKTIAEYLTKRYEDSPSVFEEEWLLIALDGDDAKYQITDIIMDWCSLHKGYALNDERSDDMKFIDHRSGNDRLYPFGDTITLRSFLAPEYVKQFGSSPSFGVRIDCDEVELIEGIIDFAILIELPSYSIVLKNKVEVYPRNCLIE